ncbi:MAG: hypothetical protein IJX69_00535 [Oscillospiraceae bacterium]|nr:hypothetical protein [Oscillospiraceae bacterium]
MKKLIALLLVLCLALSLTACGVVFDIFPFGEDTEDRRPARDDEDDDEDDDNDKKKDDGESGFAGMVEPEVEETEEEERLVGVMLPVRMEKTSQEADAKPWVETYEYDEQGYLVLLTKYNTDGTVSFTETYTNTPQGDPLRREYRSDSYAVTYDYEYDSLGNQIVAAKNGEALDFTLDAEGRVSSYQYEYGGYYEITYAEDGKSYIRWKYRDDGTLEDYTEVYLDEQGNVVSTWRYTPENSLLYRVDYIFDERGNHIQTLNYGFCSDSHVGTTYTYTYDEYNNLLEVYFEGDYYSADSHAVYTLGQVEVTESAAIRLGQR